MPCVYLPGPAPAVTVANSSDTPKKLWVACFHNQLIVDWCTCKWPFLPSTNCHVVVTWLVLSMCPGDLSPAVPARWQRPPGDEGGRPCRADPRGQTPGKWWEKSERKRMSKTKKKKLGIQRKKRFFILCILTSEGIFSSLMLPNKVAKRKDVT